MREWVERMREWESLREWDSQTIRVNERVRKKPSVYSVRDIFDTSSKIDIDLKELIILTLFGYFILYLA